ncbi:MAG: exodeoxyribonuclease VII small subunit [Dehalococcoidia bacterium]|nr:exodeoxyribonuclease VII small subunit [Dehalococcoidia bacterium]
MSTNDGKGQPKSSKGSRASFEDAFSRLEQTVQALESGGLTLEEATRLYEEGMRLARQCNELLSATELKIRRLQTAYGLQIQMVSDGADEAEDAEGDAS